jgi:hypothetical protein
MVQRGLNREAAKKLIHERDSEQKEFFRYAFQMDWNDPSLYDLIINTEKTRIHSAANIIQAAQLQQIRTCSMTELDCMERLSLTKRIDATLLKNHFNLPRLYVEVPEKGVAQIGGWAFTEAEKESVLEIVKRVPGISEVRSEVFIVPDAYN